MPDKSMFFISTIFRLEKGVLGRSCQESKRAACEVRYRYQDSQNRSDLDDEESKLSVELAKETDAKMTSKSGKRVL